TERTSWLGIRLCWRACPSTGSRHRPHRDVPSSPADGLGPVLAGEPAAPHPEEHPNEHNCRHDQQDPPDHDLPPRTILDLHWPKYARSEEHTSELQSLRHLVC